MTKYNKWINAEPRWLKRCEIPADPIFGLTTDGNAMSVWIVDNDKGLIDRTVVALAAKRGKLEDFEYVLLDSKVVEKIGIKTDDEEGNSLDSSINELHINLIEISARKLLKLTKSTLYAIKKEDTRLERIPRKKVARYILDSINEGRIDRKLANRKVLKRVLEVLGDSVNKTP